MFQTRQQASTPVVVVGGMPISKRVAQATIRYFNKTISTVAAYIVPKDLLQSIRSTASSLLTSHKLSANEVLPFSPSEASNGTRGGSSSASDVADGSPPLSPGSRARARSAWEVQERHVLQRQEQQQQQNQLETATSWALATLPGTCASVRNLGRDAEDASTQPAAFDPAPATPPSASASAARRGTPAQPPPWAETDRVTILEPGVGPEAEAGHGAEPPRRRSPRPPPVASAGCDWSPLPSNQLDLPPAGCESVAQGGLSVGVFSYGSGPSSGRDGSSSSTQLAAAAAVAESARVESAQRPAGEQSPMGLDAAGDADVPQEEGVGGEGEGPVAEVPAAMAQEPVAAAEVPQAEGVAAAEVPQAEGVAAAEVPQAEGVAAASAETATAVEGPLAEAPGKMAEAEPMAPEAADRPRAATAATLPPTPACLEGAVQQLFSSTRGSKPSWTTPACPTILRILDTCRRPAAAHGSRATELAAARAGMGASWGGLPRMAPQEEVEALPDNPAGALEAAAGGEDCGPLGWLKLQPPQEFSDGDSDGEDGQ